MTEVYPTTGSCPDLGTWEALLNEADLESQRSDLCRHLENCPACQQTVEILAGDSVAWADAAQGLSSEHALAREPGLRAAIQRLKEVEPPLTPEPADGVAEVLACLRPAGERTDLLGYLGPHEVRAVIGWGGMGVVLRAFDPTLHRLVAIKVLAPHLASNAAARQRFVREARAAAAITHDHVLTIHAVEEANGLPYLVMPFIAGPSLQEILDRRGPLPVPEILRVGMQTAAGLAAAHAQGLVHRDIKPANILLERPTDSNWGLANSESQARPTIRNPGAALGRVKITDFGLARAVNDSAGELSETNHRWGDASITQEGVVTGTPQYMAPEQARGEAIDHRADLFSLGSLLYALCTGHPPFQGSSVAVVLHQVIEALPTPLRTLNPDIPEWLETLVMRLLARNPDDRPDSATELAALLEQTLARLRQLDTPTTSAGCSSRRRWPLLVAAALVVAAALLVATLAFTETTGMTGVFDAVAAVLRLWTADGILVVEVDDPQIRVHVDGQKLLITAPGRSEVRLRGGEHHLRASKGQMVYEETITIARGSKQILRVRLNPTTRGPGGAGGLGRPSPGRKLRQLEPLPGEGMSLAQPVAVCGTREACPPRGVFSPDGKTLATGFWNGTTILWDLTSGRQRALACTSSAGMRAMAMAPDGRTLATGTADGVIHLWELESGQLVRQLTSRQDRILGLAFAPDSATLISVGGNENQPGHCSVWNVAEGKLRRQLRSDDLEMWSVAYAPHGAFIALGMGREKEGMVALISSANHQVLGSFQFPAPIQPIAFSPDGKHLAAGYRTGGVVKILDLEKGVELSSFQAHSPALFDLQYLPGGRQLLTAGMDGTAVLWDLQERAVKRSATFRGHQHQAWMFATVSPDGRLLASGGMQRTIHLWTISPLLSSKAAAPGQ